MKVSETQTVVDNWIKKYGVRYFNELTNTAILMEEVGELARHMSRIYGEQSYKTKEEKELGRENLKEEIADVFFVLICIANQTGVDLEQAFIETLEKKTIRDATRHLANDKL
jgi:NTP pyrophosphatase (non-canonical NTP hydrolase)